MLKIVSIFEMEKIMISVSNQNLIIEEFFFIEK